LCSVRISVTIYSSLTVLNLVSQAYRTTGRSVARMYFTIYIFVKQTREKILSRILFAITHINNTTALRENVVFLIRMWYYL
jgi:hypothetical protein